MTPLSPDDLFRMADIGPPRAAKWRDDIAETDSGVYVISIADASIVRLDQISEEKERKYWNPDQRIIYIGRASGLSLRLRQFYMHKYGNKVPHRGGQAVLTIEGCPMEIHYAAVKNCQLAEEHLLESFKGHAGVCRLEIACAQPE